MSTVYLLPVGYPVNCSCPRALYVAGRLRDHITRGEDGRPGFPSAAPFLGLKVWHRDECSQARPHLERAS